MSGLQVNRLKCSCVGGVEFGRKMHRRWHEQSWVAIGVRLRWERARGWRGQRAQGFGQGCSGWELWREAQRRPSTYRVRGLDASALLYQVRDYNWMSLFRRKV
jgi:hypothetical protein